MKKNILSLNENIRKTPAERLGADIVIALAVTHHLILTQKVKLDTIVELLYSYGKRYVIVEFMPLGLWSEGAINVEVPDWYNLDWFIDGMKKIRYKRSSANT